MNFQHNRRHFTNATFWDFKIEKNIFVGPFEPTVEINCLKIVDVSCFKQWPQKIQHVCVE